MLTLHCHYTNRETNLDGYYIVTCPERMWPEVHVGCTLDNEIVINGNINNGKILWQEPFHMGAHC